MKVLYVNHTGQVSGAERSLLDLLGGIALEVDARVACPHDGPLSAAASALGVHVLRIVGTDGSLKLHPAETPRAVATLGCAAIQVAHHARAFGADLVHANSIRAGIVAVAAGRLCRASVVVHLRDRLPRGRVADAAMKLIARGATTVIANSRYTADGLTTVAGRQRDVVVIPNAVDLARFDPSRVDREQARRALGVPPRAVALGVVGQITPWKGQEEAVRSLAILAEGRPELHLYIVGEAKFVSPATRYDNRAYLANLERLIRQEGLSNRVHLLGERADVPEILAALDILLVPSWEEPFGRVVIEGMAMGLGVIATSVGGPAEILHDGVDGLLLAPRDPGNWARTIDCLCADCTLRSGLGRRGVERARAFDVRHHVRAVLRAYEETVAATAGMQPRWR